MNEVTSTPSATPNSGALNSAVLRAAQACQECLGSGGWYRYEPALEPAPGMLYLSCMQCRGTGRRPAAEARG